MQRADIITQENDISYFVNQPVSIFRTYSLSVNQFNNWDFGLTHLSSGAQVRAYLEFLNKWGVSANCGYTTQALDTRLLRGGHAMLVRRCGRQPLYQDGSFGTSVWRSRQALRGQATAARNIMLLSRVNGHPFNTLRIAMSQLLITLDRLQYIETKLFRDQTRYLLGRISQHTLGATFRIDYNITPELSIQYYGSHLLSAGHTLSLRR
jgi:hypothetical protein